jgi:hypothetical protein
MINLDLVNLIYVYLYLVQKTKAHYGTRNAIHLDTPHLEDVAPAHCKFFPSKAVQIE